jgi:hypothetical protein
VTIKQSAFARSWLLPFLLLILILAVSVPAAYIFGKADGYKAGADYALAEMEKQLGPALEQPLNDVLLQAMLDGSQAGIDMTVKQFTPILDQCNELATALLADLQTERQWTNESARRSAEWLYDSPRDPQEAYDLLWCVAGKASPLENCLQQLEDGRGG